MPYRLPVRLAALALTLAAGQVQAQDTVTADTVLATVNGVDITAGHLIMMRAQLPEQYQAYPDNVLYDGLLGQAVQQALLAGSVDELSPLAQLALDNETRTLLANEGMQQISDAAVTEDAIEAAYDERFADAEPQREYNASHILVETEEEAAAIVEELAGGAEFAALAREKSTGPSGPNGGSLGWFGRGAMVPTFDAAVAEMEPGETSGPVQTDFGWHVIRLNEARMSDVPELEEVREEIVAEIQRQAIEARLAELEAEGDVSRTALEEVDPGFLSNPTLLQ